MSEAPLPERRELLGFSVKVDGPLRQAWSIVQGVSGGRTNLAALAVGGSALALILWLKRRPRVPGMLYLAIHPAESGDLSVQSDCSTRHPHGPVLT